MAHALRFEGAVPECLAHHFLFLSIPQENSEELLNLDSHRVGILKPRVMAILVAGLFAAATLLKLDITLKPAAHSPARASILQLPQLYVNYAKLPLSFEPNQGQSAAPVKFVARGSGYALFLTGNEAVLTLQGPSRDPSRDPSQKKQASILRVSLEHANNSVAVDGTDKLPGKSNYFIGNNPAKWHRDIPQFARVRYHDVYPGIDLVYYGNQGKLEYDFEVAPGADPKQIALRIEGATGLKRTENDGLKIETLSGDIQLQAPRLYQPQGSIEKLVNGRFVVQDGNQVSFAVGEYDRSRVLVIDPVLSYSTYLGGSGSESCSAIEQTQLGISTALFTPGCPAIAVDAAFRAYVAGATTSLDFPGVTAPTATPANPSFQECLDTPPNPNNPSSCATTPTAADVFITRLNAAGTALDFSTYLGGSGTDVPGGMAVDQNFNVHVAGTTNSADFPTSLITAFQPAPVSTGTHVFVSELNSAGTKLIYSTYLSGHGTDIASGIAVDNLGKEYVSGITTSPAFPTSGGFPTTPTGAQPKAVNQYFFSKLDPTISGPGSLVYSTYLGGSAPANGVTMGGGIAVDSSCNAYLTGGTNFTDMPSQNASQGTNLGGIDAWLAKFTVAQGSSCGSQLSLQYLTYLGGTGDDIGYGVAVDTGLSVYVTGSTTSQNIALPTGSGAPAPFAKCLDSPPPALGPYPACPSGVSASDAFIAKFGPLATTSTTGTNVPYNYFTYLGGTGPDAGTAIAVDSIGGASVTGWTSSTDFPVVGGATQSSYGGGTSDAFFARIDTTTVCASNPPTVVCPGFSTYLGGSLADVGTSIALDSQGGSYLAGETTSPNFPLASPLQASRSGPSDAFVTKFGSIGNFTVTPTTPTTVGVGNTVAFTYTITNTGDPASSVIVTDTLPSTATLSSISVSTGSCGSTVGSVVTCSIGSLNTGATVTVTVNLIPTASATPLTTPGQLSNSISVTAPGAQQKTVSSTTQIQDFNIQVQPGTPSTITVPAGVPASFTFQIFGTLNTFPNAISLSAAAGLPTPSTTVWSTNPIPSLAGSVQTSVLTITTVARVTTTGKLWLMTRSLYASWLPFSGIAFLGLGIGGAISRKRKFVGVLLGGFFLLVLFQLGCGGGRSSTTTTTGTPAGTYTITIDATSGSAMRTTTVMLIVQ